MKNEEVIDLLKSIQWRIEDKKIFAPAYRDLTESDRAFNTALELSAEIVSREIQEIEQ